MEDIKIRIKNLLNKAESTEFEPEAEVFYAKAASLMAEHAISEEMLSQIEGKKVDDIEVRPIIVPNPYSADRMHLLFRVAVSLGGHAYYIPQARDGYKTRHNIKDHNTYGRVIGFQSDVDSIVQMFESLSRQCDKFRELARPQWEQLGRGDKKVWHSTFIRGYAQRIGYRLHQSYQDIINEQSGSVALAIRNKEEVVAQKMKELGLKTTRSTKKHNSGAYAAGKAAADRASIHKEINR